MFFSNNVLPSAITSQNGTAPKPIGRQPYQDRRAITSQNGTAPKLPVLGGRLCVCAITSQNGTAPKPWWSVMLATNRAITSQNGTAPKQGLREVSRD